MAKGLCVHNVVEEDCVTCSGSPSNRREHEPSSPRTTHDSFYDEMTRGRNDVFDDDR